MSAINKRLFVSTAGTSQRNLFSLKSAKPLALILGQVITQTQYSPEDEFVQIDLLVGPPAGVLSHAVFLVFLSNSDFVFLDSSYIWYFLMFVSCNCGVTGLLVLLVSIYFAFTFFHMQC